MGRKLSIISQKVILKNKFILEFCLIFVTHQIADSSKDVQVHRAYKTSNAVCEKNELFIKPNLW